MIKGVQMVGALTTVGLLATGCGGATDGASGGSLVVATWGSTYEQAQVESIIGPFEEAEGVKVTVESPFDLARLRVMVESGKPTWDVYPSNSTDAVAYCGTLFEKIDMTNIVAEDFAPGSLSDCGIPSETYSYLLAYNTEKFGDNPPTSVLDFFDTERFPGTRAMSNDPMEGNFELALMADGVPADQLYPLDYDRSIKILDRIKNGAFFWSTGAEQIAAMEQQRADLILVWSGRGHEATKNGAPYAPVWQDSSFHWSSVSIVKGSPHRELAQKYVEFATSPEAQTRWAETSAYGAANLSATPQLDPEQAEWDSSLEDHRAVSWQIDNEWWGQHQDEVIARWTAWTSG